MKKTNKKQLKIKYGPEEIKEVLEAVRKLCKHRYVLVRDFPPSLRRKCIKIFKSVRRAKWEAGIIDDTVWKYKAFLKYVGEFCEDKYREDREWDPRSRYWAKYHCGSIRAAKYEAKVILDRRFQERHKTKRSMTKESLIIWIRKNRIKKVHYWPPYIIYHSVRLFKSPRGAQISAGVLEKVKRSKYRQDRH